MNKTAIWGGVAGLAAAVIVGGSIWSGSVAQTRIQSEFGQIGKAIPLHISEASYERGLFSSQHTFKIQLGCDKDAAANSPALTIRQRIQHGPLPGFISLGRAAIETELETPAELRALLKNGAETPALIKARTVFGLAGGHSTKVSTAALEFQEGKSKGQLSVKELVLQIRQSSSGKITYELNWPGMTGVSLGDKSAGNVEVEAFSVRGETAFDASNPLWFAVGKVDVDLKSFDLDIQSPTGKPVKMAFSKITSDSETTAENGLLNNVSRLRGQGSVNDLQLSKLRFDTSFKRLHAPTYAQLLQGLLTPQSLCGGAAQSALAAPGEAGVAAMAALLVHDPELAVDALELEIDGFAGEMAYSFGTKGLTQEELKSAEARSALLNKSYVSGHFEIPTVWLEKIIIDAAPSRQAQDKAMLEAMITQAVDQGYVKREGNFLSSKFKVEKGVIQVNDKPLGPAFGP